MQTVKATPTQTLLFYPAQIISTTASPLVNIKTRSWLNTPGDDNAFFITAP
jgi:hypothetical protein